MDTAVAEDNVRTINLLYPETIPAQDVDHHAVLLSPVGGDQRQPVENDTIGIVGHGIDIVINQGFQSRYAVHGVIVGGQHRQRRFDRFLLGGSIWIA